MKQVELRDMGTLSAGQGGCNTMEEYGAMLDRDLLEPMRGHQVGCVMALMSAQELRSSCERVTAGGIQSLVVPQGSRLLANLKVCFIRTVTVLHMNSHALVTHS